MSHPACLIRRQRSVSSEIDEEALVEDPALSSASRLASMNDPDVQSHSTSLLVATHIELALAQP